MADVTEILAQWDAGEDISRIARSLGYSRPTVRKYIAAARAVGLESGAGRRGEGEWERLARRAVASVQGVRAPSAAWTAVAVFHERLAERVGAVRPSVLYQRLHDDEGLAASWGTFYRYVRAHWPERLGPPARVTVRLADPAPGEEAQVDFFYVGRWWDPEAGRERKLYAFLMTLGHSRHAFLYPVLAEDGAAWLDGHVEAFHFFGGAPRRLVPDNLSAGVRRPDRYDPRLNRSYAELARYYGCVVDPSRVRHPQDKPKVERNVDYARESFFRGRDFASLGEMREGARDWCLKVAGERVHGTTKERPLAAFLAREQPALLALPPRRWERALWTTAKVQADCHARVLGVAYSVPHPYVGRTLEARVGGQTVELYLRDDLVTSHLRQERGRVTRDEDYPEGPRKFLLATPQYCQRQAEGIGAAAAAALAAMLAPKTLTGLREAQATLRLAETYGATRLEAACRRAAEAGDGRYRTIRGLLERGLDQLAPEPAPAPTPAGAFLRGPAAFAVAGEEER